MKLSVIIATRNRAHAITGCLDSIAAAFAKAEQPDAEIVVIDNGSADNTFASVTQWAASSPLPVRLLAEPKTGLARAHNCALLAAQGELLAFTDDDCRLHPEYVNDLLRHHAADSEPVLRGWRVELGDPTDLPLTTKTTPAASQWSRRLKAPIAPGDIHGCNMTMPRILVQKLGPFDERFGVGSNMIPAADDTDYFLRAHFAGFTLAYVPNMTIIHCHSRKTTAQGNKLMQGYAISNGAIYAKHGWKDFPLYRPFFRHAKQALREIITGTNCFIPSIGFSYRDSVRYAVQGALRYWFMASRKRPG
jgi:glycosyltransferase involved in cell wall biosynthesis